MRLCGLRASYFFLKRERFGMVKKRRILIVGIFISILILMGSMLFLLGMGDLGGKAPKDKIPEPEKNFTVQVFDIQEIQTGLTHFSQDGRVFLEGKRGKASITIPFEKISQIHLQNLKGDEISAKVSLRNGDHIEMQLNRKAIFYGKAKFGTFQIEAKDLKSIRFQP
jgi:hypothetical protein